jgi:hypothetical protein
MHLWCQDETNALLAGLPFLSYWCQAVKGLWLRWAK